jgi:hypothetical protein
VSAELETELRRVDREVEDATAVGIRGGSGVRPQDPELVRRVREDPARAAVRIEYLVAELLATRREVEVRSLVIAAVTVLACLLAIVASAH